MARVNIEEDAWKRIYELRDFLKCSLQEASGTVACLWSTSQDFVKTHGTKSEILLWAKLFDLSDDQSEKIISALENARFISVEKNGLYKIHGNDIQIESRAKHLSKSSKGGKALKKKLQELKRLQAKQGTATGTPEESHRGLNTRQDKAIQGKTRQSKTKQYVLTAATVFSDLSVIYQPDHEPFFKKLQVKVVETWLQIYPAEWVNSELLRAIAWIHANPHKGPKSDFPKYFNNWLSRGWETHRKTIPSNKIDSSRGGDLSHIFGTQEANS